MNLMAVSERHQMLVLAVNEKLLVYQLDPLSCSVIEEIEPIEVDL